MKIVSRPQFEYQLCKRKNKSKFIKILLYINDADGYVEVGRINQTKSWWTDQGYGEIEEIEDELSNNTKVAEFVATTQPTLLSKKTTLTEQDWKYLNERLKEMKI